MSSASAIMSRSTTLPATLSGTRTAMMRAWASGLRRNATSHRPGIAMSATKLPLPCRWRASSLRGTRAPTPWRAPAGAAWPAVCVLIAILYVASGFGLIARHRRERVVVQGGLGHAEPAGLVGLALLPVRVDRLELRVLVGQFVPQFLRGLVYRVHHFLGEETQLGAAGDELALRQRVAGVVVGQHFHGLLAAGALEGSLVGRRQRLPGLVVDHGGDRRAALEPAGRVIERRHLVEAELFVVVRADPLGGVDGALLQRGIDV